MLKLLMISDFEHEYGSLDYSFYNAFCNSNYQVQTLYLKKPKILRIFEKKSFFYRFIYKLLNITFYFKFIFFLKIKFSIKKKFDLIFVLKGLNLSSYSIRELKKLDSKLISFNPDDPFNLISSSNSIKNNIKYFDHYFIWSKNLCEKIEKIYGIKTTFLPFAADPSVHKINKVKVQKNPVITFIGNWDDEREKWLSKIDTKNCLKIYGFNWENNLKNKTLKSCLMGHSIHPKKFSAKVHQSQINLNILRTQNKNASNMRTYEIIISGGFQLHEFSEEVAEIFIEGKEIEFFKSHDELNEKISFYLKNPSICNSIAKAGFEKINSSNNFYTDRVRKIEKSIYDT